MACWSWQEFVEGSFMQQQLNILVDASEAKTWAQLSTAHGHPEQGSSKWSQGITLCFRRAHVAPESFTKKAYKLDWILQ